MAGSPVTTTPSLSSAHELVHDFVAAALPQADRLRLAATCRTLRSGSLRWFPEVQAELTSGNRASARSLAAWLCLYRARAHVSFRADTVTLYDSRRKTAVPSMLRLLAARPAAAASVTLLSACRSTWPDGFPCEVPTRCLLAFPSIEGLQCGFDFLLVGPVEPLWQLTQLQRLKLRGYYLSGDWTGIACLSQLQHLELEDPFDAAAVPLPAGVSNLQALTRLSLGWRPAHQQQQAATGLEHLRSLAGTLADLNLAGRHLAAIPPVLTALTALTRLNLSHNSIKGGWGQLQALPRLRKLDPASLTFIGGGLAAAPPQLAACSRLTRLKLGSLERIFAVDSLSVLGSLHSLQHLTISLLLDVDAVPAVLSQLSKLTHLSLQASCSTGFSNLQPLTLLEELSIFGTNMQEWQAAELAATLAALPSVTSRALSSLSIQPSWDPAWRAILQMTQLRALALDCCACEPPPAGLSNLQALTRLSLGMRLDLRQQPAATGLEHLHPLAGTLDDLSLTSYSKADLRWQRSHACLA
ncbi:hypothetical protein ABPG77_002667 [Micractinium sp. CCAP 211/92]